MARARSAPRTQRLADATRDIVGGLDRDGDEARRRQGWQRAATTITTLLLSGADPLTVRSAVTGHARQLDGAAAAAIVAPAEDPELLRVVAGSGGLDPRVAGELLPAGDALTRDALTRPPGLGPAVAAPLDGATGDERLLVVRGPQQRPFRPPDVELISSFAAHVGLVLELAEQRRRRDVQRLVEDRERIAAQLSERAMRALLEIGTTVHGLTARMQSPEDARRLAEQVNRLDGVLHEMRRAIFGLQGQPGQRQGSAAR